jgi:hypothetical protein
MRTANAESRSGSRQHSVKRRHPRHLLSVSVTLYRYSAAGPLLVAHGMSIDISRGGIGMIVCGPPQVGEAAIVNVKLLDSAFEALAVVRHSNPTRSGFQFVELSPEIQKRIEASAQKPQTFPWPLNPFMRK